MPLIHLAVFVGVAWGVACLVVLAGALLLMRVTERKEQPLSSSPPKLEVVRDCKADIGPALRRPR